MENNKSKELLDKIKDKAGRLLTYLTELERIKSKVVRSVDDYQNVLWLSDIPVDSEYCFTQAWGKNEEYDNDTWIEIRKYKEPFLEGIPTICRQWVNWKTLKNTEDIPELLESIVVQEEVENPDADPEDLESEEFITINKTIYLKDYPEVSEEWEQFVESKWMPWAELHQKWQSVQRVYAKLFSIHQEQQKLGEQYELVLGLGLLSWRIPAGLIIKRHFITANALLEFDAKIGKFTVIPAVEGADIEAEFDMLDPEDQPPNLRQTIIDGLKNANDDPWDYSSIEPLLKVIANSLADKGQGEYFNSLEKQKKISEKPVVEYAPALILRKRSIKGILQTLKTIKEQIDSGGEVPSEFFDLLEINNSKENDETFDESTNSQIPQTIYFPKPYNDEQFEIIRRLQEKKGVLVQGPPGTGKSHTIANLVCHYLANGKRILVTAKTPRALKVLYKQMPAQIRPLCVSLLGTGLEEKQSLEESVGSILNKQDGWNKNSSRDHTEYLEKRIKNLKSEKAKINKRIRAIRESETIEQSIFGGKYVGTSARIARILKEESKQYQWFRDKISFDQEIPISKDEIQVLLKNINLLKPEKESEYKKNIPDPEKDLLNSNEFEEMIDDYNKTENNFYSVKNLVETFDGKILSEKSIDEINKILKALIDLTDAINEIERHQMTWTKDAVFDVLTGTDSFWKDFLNTFTERMEGLKEHAKEINDLDVKLPEEVSLMSLIRDAKIIKEHFDQGGKNRFWIFKSKEIKRCKYITEEIFINSETCKSCDKLEVLIKYLEIKNTINSCWDLWSGRLERTSDPFLLQIARLKEMKNLLKKVVLLSNLLESLKVSLDCVKEIKHKMLWHKKDELINLMNTCKAVILENSFDKAKSTLEQYIQKVESFASKPNSHDVSKEVLKIIQDKDTKSYSEILTKIDELKEISEKINNTREILNRLSKFAPILANDLLQENTEVLSEFKNIENAWYWARANSWLNDFINKDDLPSLERRLEQTNKLIDRNMAKLSALLAWNYSFDRMSESHRRFLVAWQVAFKKASMKYTKFKSKFMKDAQKQLSKCKEAIPAWVMPLHRVYETIEPNPEMFDLIIVDEASQCGPEALPLTYLGKQILVVGDNKQISPTAVGIPMEQIFRLRDEYLNDFEHSDSFSIDSSLFDHGRLRFGAPIVLREHFRCMPEIIRFSNHLCYRQTPLIPLRQYPPDRLEPLKTVYVAEGYREGKNSRVINRPEAEKLVEQIVKCCNDFRYDGKTMGVITLQGNSQASLIENMLLEELDSEEMTKRKLICGDPYSFQGDERDIIFLSMVAAPNERIGALVKEADERRFNVAASRAKDQLWLFYSVTHNDLSYSDLRKKLIEFFEDPADSVIIPPLGLEDLQLKTHEANRQIEKAPLPFDSWFEVDVYLQIVSKGFSVIPQFKVGGKKIDLVIEGNKTRLAVECYGEYWHGPNEYEHDTERQRILERCGWNFYIIREAEYYANPEEVIERLCEKLKQMGIYSLNDPEYVKQEEKIGKNALVNDNFHGKFKNYKEIKSKNLREDKAINNIINGNIEGTRYYASNIEKKKHPVTEKIKKDRNKEIYNQVASPKKDGKSTYKEKMDKKGSFQERFNESLLSDTSTDEEKLKKLGKLSEKQIKYYKIIFDLYEVYGDCAKVARRLGLTNEKIQQILEQVRDYGLFEYPINKNKYNFNLKERINLRDYENFKLTSERVRKILERGKKEGLFELKAENEKTSYEVKMHTKDSCLSRIKKLPISDIPEDETKINNCRLSDRKIKYYKKIFDLFKKYGDIAKVARNASLTSERVQQILERGNELGLFEYPIKNNQQFLFVKKKIN